MHNEHFVFTKRVPHVVWRSLCARHKTPTTHTIQIKVGIIECFKSTSSRHRSYRIGRCKATNFCSDRHGSPDRICRHAWLEKQWNVSMKTALLILSPPHYGACQGQQRKHLVLSTCGMCVAHNDFSVWNTSSCQQHVQTVKMRHW